MITADHPSLETVLSHKNCFLRQRCFHARRGKNFNKMKTKLIKLKYTIIGSDILWYIINPFTVFPSLRPAL